MILIIRDSDGHTGFGEIAPLPGLDRETDESCRHDMALFKSRYTGKVLAMRDFDVTMPLFGLCGLDISPGPSALFGIESALLILSIKHHAGPLPGILAGFEGDIPVKVNGLFIPGTGASAGQIRYLKENNFKTIKIKIGRAAREREIIDIKELAGSIPGAVFRLDGNRILDPAGLREYHHDLRDLNVEYLEEPFPEGQQGDIPWPFAADESLNGCLDRVNPDFTKIPRTWSAMIIKPGSLWGLHNIIRAVRWGDINNFTVTLSSSYNSGAGLTALGLAGLCSVEYGKKSHGLDTYKYLEGDLLNAKLSFHDGELRIPRSLFLSDDAVDLRMLQEVFL